MAWQRWITIGIILGILLLVFALLMPAVYRARVDARKMTSKNNLKQIGLAFHNYSETHGYLPPGGVIREDETAMHGWITMLMPYMEASPYYAMIDFHIPWDNLDNIEIFEQSRPSYMNPSIAAHFTSTGYGLTHYLGNPNVLYRNSCVEFDQMMNGTAHTWMVGEIAGNFQPWGFPFNWRPLGTKLCAGPQSFGYPAWDGGHLLIADGSVSFFSKATSPEILKRFADAPPIATKEQTAVPSKIFQTGLYHWKHIDLQADPESKSKYYVYVLRSGAGTALVIRIFTYEESEPSEESAMSKKWDIPTPHLLFQVDSTTDIARALEATTLFKTATPEQFQANVKTLQAIQGQLE